MLLFHSLSEFIVFGLGGALLLDHCFTRLLPWSEPIRWRRQILPRVGFFALGMAVFYYARPGIVPIWEAAHRGAGVSLGVFLLESIALLQPLRSISGWCRAAGIALVVLACPIIGGLHPLRTVPKRTPQAMGLAFENVCFQTADGLRLRGWLVPHPQPRGNVLFCHGHGRNRGHVAGLLPTLRELGLNVLAFDFRGHGESEGRTSTFGQREVQDVIAAAAFLRRRFPDQPLFIVGISMGAASTLQALPQLPDVRGVWVEGCFSRLDDTVEHFFRWIPQPVRRPFLLGEYVLAWLDCGLWAPRVSPLEALADVRVPIHFCHGCQDELVPFVQAEQLYARHRGPRECYWAAGASHYNVRQRNRAEYLHRLRNFLSTSFSPGA